MQKPFEKAILHFDGDSFFSSVEQALDYRLKGKPIVTGGERGAITSASIEAKKFGINRGYTLGIAKEICPDLIVVPGNYLAYSIFAERMYAIVREFTDIVEEYSIDECFADITGLDKLYNKSYEEIALMIKEKLETSLGITFGAGLGPNKVLAKVASKHRKPAGFTAITPENLEEFLDHLPLGKIWGIGPAQSIALGKLQVKSAGEFVQRPERWVEHHVAKPCFDIWRELQGYYIKELGTDYEAPQSIIKSRTFRPPTTNPNFLLSQLSKNIEAACSKARRHKLLPREVSFYLKTQEFTYHGYSFPLPFASASPAEILKWVNNYFGKVYRPKTLYRATGVSLRKFAPGTLTPDLFGESARVESQAAVFKAVDIIARKFGEHAVHLASSAHPKSGIRKTRKEIDLPYLGIAR